MAEKDIIQNLISQLGQSQDNRMPAELATDFAKIDERTTEDLLLFTRNFAEYVNFYSPGNSSPTGNWTKFFPNNLSEIKQLLENNNEQTDPHLALFLSFLELYKEPQRIINQLTQNHLDFYYQSVLKLQKKAPVPDKAHVLIELKKNVDPISINSENLFTAGKDKSGTELLYAPVDETIVNQAKVGLLKSIFWNKSNKGSIHYAPIANSSDGVGSPLDENDPKWDAFGNTELPEAEVGFAIASPTLRMAEGNRIITVNLTLKNIPSGGLNLKDAFDVYITGQKKWLGPYTVSPALSGSSLSFSFTVPETEKAVIDYNKDIHGYSYVAHAPVIQVLLKEDNKLIGYNNLKNIQLVNASVSVEVSKITSLNLSNDNGSLDPKKAFFPFGTQPVKDSSFYVGYQEALSKKLSEVQLNVEWKDAPANFYEHYKNYDNKYIKNDYFTASVSFNDGDDKKYSSNGVKLFETGNAALLHTFLFTTGTNSSPVKITRFEKNYALQRAKSRWATRELRKSILIHPVFPVFYGRQLPTPEPKEGFITFKLDNGFQHAEYRIENVRNLLKYSLKKEDPLVQIKEPYTPAIKSISMSYKAYSGVVAIGTDDINSFADEDIKFFHVAYFGQMLEHSYQRNKLPFVTDKNVNLLPSYNNEGELLIGLSNLNPNDSVSILFQVANGSNNPDLPQQNIEWSVLCDNYWKKLDNNNVISDTTNKLLTSGIIRFIIPPDATAENTILPTDYIWIKGAVANNTKAICKLIEVSANAVEVQFKDSGNTPEHLQTALTKGSITKLKNGHSSVKSIKQPYASFGGHQAELDNAFYTRVSERLRHKNRCITPWDYERLILGAFPKIHKVKCIPHAKNIPNTDEYCWLAPGNVVIIVIPDLRNQNSPAPLYPKVDSDTISKITAFLTERTGMQVKVKVKNPGYQKIKLDFNVKFHTKYEFNFTRKKLMQQITEFLSPWAFESNRDISFGGKIYKSVLLDFVEDLDYVDYVTDFKMYSYIAPPVAYRDISEVQPATPDAILVSEETHTINQIV